MTDPIVALGNPDNARALIVVFLRGGADGLALVPPVDDDGYQRARPRIAIPATGAIRLSGPFALHPCMAALEPIYREGRLAVVHAAGSDDPTRSHFEAQDRMERAGTGIAGGWLGRWLRADAVVTTGPRSALASVAIGSAAPECLRGAPSVTVMRSFADLDLGADGAWLRAPLDALYAGDGMLGDAATSALRGLDAIATMRSEAYVPAHGAEYGQDDFARGMAQIAQLVKAQVGLRAATLDYPGWDSHFFQGPLIEPMMRSLAATLAAFTLDLGQLLDTTSVVVMSEFGRRVYENSSLGTDHGRGGALLVLGGGTPGGMHCRWPGLEGHVLEGPGDVPVVHDYRDVLAGVLSRCGSSAATAAAFPGWELAPLAV
ncbi:MAG: DUF1501 domain-containing protein [Planctomycetes bacterium]|nr:DUF1501 domain-containing protein [Planctomycetota bacterium]